MAEIRFLHRTAELTLHDRLRSSEIQGSWEVGQAPYKDAPWLALYQASLTGLTQDLRERLYLTVDLTQLVIEMSGITFLPVASQFF